MLSSDQDSFRASMLSLGFSHSRLWLYRVLVSALLLSSLLLIFAEYHQLHMTTRLRSAITSIAMPIVNVLSQPAQTTESVVRWAKEISLVHTQNLQLRKDNAALVKWQAIAQELQRENASLRRLLHVSFSPEKRFHTARIIAGAGGAYGQSMLINSGSDQGIKKYQAVVDEKGMVGTVMKVDNNRAWLLPVTNINARIPVVLERTRERAILAGQGDDTMHLLYLSGDSGVMPGDRIITSGDGKALPAGLPVGVVSYIDEKTGITEAMPLVPTSRLDYVRIIDYRE